MQEKLELKYKNIEIIYVTPKKQLWGISDNGIKKCIFKKITHGISFEKFKQSRKLISYEDCKLFGKEVKYKFISNTIELILKNEKFIVEVLANDSFKAKNEISQCLGFNKSGLRCKRIVSDDYCYQHEKPKNCEDNLLLYNKSPLRYPGGKTRACETLHEILNKRFNLKNFKHLTSPFFGGGSFEFFLSNKYNYEVFANDAYSDLFNFWHVCQTHKRELSELFQPFPNINKENFKDCKKRLESSKSSILRAYYFFILNRCSFNGTSDSGGFSKIAAKKRLTQSSVNLISNLDLSKFTITNEDFEVFLKTNGREDSLIFLDPPYFSNKSSKLYGRSGDLHTNFDHKKLFRLISTKYNWIMTYDNCNYIKDLYKDFDQIEVSWSYGMSSTKKELVILGKFFPKKKTLALENESQHKKSFQEKVETLGLKIMKEYSPFENRKYFTSADYLCEIVTEMDCFGKKGEIITVSLKTPEGAFTLCNPGVTRERSGLFKGYSFSKLEKKLFYSCYKKVKKLHNDTSGIFWRNEVEIKEKVKNVYANTFFKLYNNNLPLINYLYVRLNHHRSDYEYIGTEFTKTTEWVLIDPIVKKVGKDKVRVGEFLLRFKAEGAQVHKSSWKINVERVR